MTRLFVAVWPPPVVVDQLAALPREQTPGVRWTRPDQWHVTLRFLGDADPDKATEALTSLRHPPVEAVLGPLVGRLGRGVLMVPVGGLQSVADTIVELTADVGVPPDPRPFLGHLTLARLKGRVACGLVDAALAATWPVEEVTLEASATEPDGARYRTVARFPLGLS